MYAIRSYYGLYLNYQHEDFSLGEDDGRVNFFIPGIALSQLRADNILFPRRGYSWTTDLRGSPGLISDTSFARLDLAGKLVYPLSKRGRLLVITSYSIHYTKLYETP